MSLARNKCLVCGLKPKPLFCFPKKVDRQKEWLKQINQEDMLLKHSSISLASRARLCPDHFEDKCFANSLKTRLTACAVPSSSLSLSVSQIGNDSLPSTSNSTGLSMSSFLEAQPSTLTPKTKKIKKLTSNISKLRRQLFKSRKNFWAIARENLSSSQFTFIQSQIKCARKDPRGYRWTSQDKAAAMNIYMQSSSTYKLLRKMFFFPSVSTLKRATGAIAKDDGLCPILLAALKQQAAKMKECDRLCTLVFDEMSIKSRLHYNPQLDKVDGYESAARNHESKPLLAGYALVFMIRGIASNWKQVVSYYFTANTSPPGWFKSKLIDVYEKITDCGFNIVATVCDQGPNNRSLYNSLGVNIEKPYFEILDKKIYALYDFPHILKCVRNNFQKYDVNFLDMKQKIYVKASWKHIEFYEFQAKQKYRLAPRLTKQHIYGKGLASMKVKLAAQVLSATVAAGLCFMVSSGSINSQAIYAADFVAKMNNTFDSMNSRFVGKDIKHAVVDSSEHIAFWNDIIDWVDTWRFIEADKKMKRLPFQNSMIISLRATIGIWELLKNDVTNLRTNRLNQDCIENTFSSVRRRGGFRDNPDCTEFRSSIRNVIIQNFVKRSQLSNCEDDYDTNLIDINTVNSKVTDLIYEHTQDDDELNIVNEICSTDIPSCIEANTISYIAGFLAKSFLKKMPCDTCQSLLVGEKIIEDDTLFLSFKEYTDTVVGLKWPTPEMRAYIQKLSHMFFHVIDNYFYKSNVRKNICSTLDQVEFDFFNCVHKEKTKTFLILSFATMLIRHKIKIMNSENFKVDLRKKVQHVKHV